MEKKLPLFHGTDARIFYLNDDIRIEFKRSLIELIDYMRPFFNPYYESDKMEDLEEKLGEPLYNKLFEALNHDTARRQGLLSWQYEEDVMYFTQDYLSAISYAKRHFVCGEIGTIASDMYFAIEKLNFKNWDPDEKQRKTIKTIKELASGEHFPMVLRYDKYECEDLLRPSGKKVEVVEDYEPIIMCRNVSIHLVEEFHFRPGNNSEIRKAARKERDLIWPLSF